LSSYGLLSSLLQLDGLGIMPKPSNLWDLMPFSFVLNWLTGVGTAMRRAEYMTCMATIPAYYVHSYTLTSPFTTDELASWRTATSTDGQLSLKLFYRDISLFSPAPRDSMFGFGIPRSLPPLGTVAALLWQVLT